MARIPGRSSMDRIVSDEQDTIELYTSAKERQHYDDQANLYSIILATEHLERAYARDCITQKEVCRREWNDVYRCALRSDMILTSHARISPCSTVYDGM